LPALRELDPKDLALYLQFLDDEPPIANRLDIHFAMQNATIKQLMRAFTGDKSPIVLEECGAIFPIKEKAPEPADDEPLYLQFQRQANQ
jgi:hypothetical protein